MKIRLPGAAAAAMVGLGVAGGAAAQSAPVAQIAEYTAAYDVDYKGRNLGTAEFSLQREDDTFVFESRAEARGLLKLVRPNPLLERSRFKLADGEIRPLTFEFEDGSRGGEENFRAAFDWQSGVVVVEHDSGRAEYELSKGVLDRGSMQVALMRDLARGESVGPYMLVDDDGIDQYHYDRVAEDETLETPAGEYATELYEQRRAGSSRVTRLWVAPALRFLPVRIAQFRDGELHTDFTLKEADVADR